MEDVDIDPFGEHESKPDEPTGKNIPLPPVSPVGGDQLGNQNMNKKRHSEEKVKELNS